MANERIENGTLIATIDFSDNRQALTDIVNLSTVGTTKTEGVDLDKRIHNLPVTIEVSMQDAYKMTDGFGDPAGFKIFRYFSQGINKEGTSISQKILEKYTGSDGRAVLTNRQLIELIYMTNNIEETKKIEGDIKKGAGFSL